MINTTLIFSVPLFTIKINNFYKKKKELNKTLKNYPEIKRPPNIFYTNKNHTDLKLRTNFCHILKEELTLVSKELKTAISVYDVWSVTYNKGEYTLPHNHGSQGYSGIMYLDFKGSSPLTTYIQPWNSSQDKTSLYPHPVEEGGMVIFPQYLLHFTEPNTDKFKKRVISFDFHKTN